MTNEPQTNVVTPRRTVDIGTKEQVKHPNGSGWVSRPSWEPTEGARRREQIEAARLQAVEDYEMSLAEEHPHARRLGFLETQVKVLKEKLELMNKQFAEVLTGGNQ